MTEVRSTMPVIEGCIKDFEKVKGFKPAKIEVSLNDYYFLSKEVTGTATLEADGVEIMDVLVEPAEYIMDGNFSMIYCI